jgi:rhodanese-related sulfurtransferase
VTGYAGDLTPQEAWEMLRDTPEATLVDIRTDAEWRYVGMPDLGDIGGRVEYIEWTTYPDGDPNPTFLDELAAVGLIPGSGTPILFICRAAHRSVDASIAATAAGLGPCYNVLEGFEGPVGDDGHRGHSGWRAAGLPWYQQ